MNPDEKRARIAELLRARQEIPRKPPRPDPARVVLPITPPYGAKYPLVRWTSPP
jgi:hypothetical protein